VCDKTRTHPAEPGDRLIRAGSIVFFVGAVATLVTMAPLFLGTTPFPTFMFGLSMLMGAGFLIAGAGVFQAIAAGRRRARGAHPLRPQHPARPPAGPETPGVAQGEPRLPGH
jgi:hypothetical protein